ncbi:hemolysin family protein [Crocosphaera sp. XPORK-15E]|uniref:hemolysin family protein n=1 Tax=Crocosphaera sp. XPORK-15E TaxID=3110247 RepID=UPI002B1F4567|nr:hemolysin family protein [Crocosphaera sp. XPORK-15E]MEA5534516.1 hemolysin family protein [Crocosphaera sp. XPORK-15E]
MTAPDILIRALSILLLIAINAFFVTAEFAMVSVRRSRISQLVEAGDIQAQTVQSLQRSIERLLSTTQLGITLSSLALGWIGESTMAKLVGEVLAKLPLPPLLTTSISHSFAIPITFFSLAYLQIVLGELCPKSVALLYAEQLARFLGPPIGVIAQIFNPFIWILNQSTRWLLRSVGIPYTGEGRYNQVTSEELQLIIATEGESTGLEAKERALLKNVFEFGEVTAVEVMVPRTQLIAIPETATFEEFLAEVAQAGHSRYPVEGDSLDDILGLIDFKNLAQPLAQGALTPTSTIEEWIKPVKFVSESMPLDELLALMQRSQLKMVMVVDEFGGTSGLITLQDLIAEILGNDLEGTGEEEVALQMIDEQTFLVEAQINLEELNHVLGLDLPLTDEYQTLGGFLLYQWQKIPTVGETLAYQSFEFTVIASEGPRLLQVRLHRKEVSETESELTETESLEVIDQSNHE